MNAAWGLVTLIAAAIIGLGIANRPLSAPSGPVPTSDTLQFASKPHCNYIQFAQRADTTFWQADCLGNAKPWDTAVIVRPDP